MTHSTQPMKRSDASMQRQGAGRERLLLKASLSGTAMAQDARMTTRSGRTTGASPTAWNSVRRLPQRLADRAQTASLCGD